MAFVELVEFCGLRPYRTKQELTLSVILSDGVDGERGKLCVVNPPDAGHLFEGVVTRVLVTTALPPPNEKPFSEQGGWWVLSLF